MKPGEFILDYFVPLSLSVSDWLFSFLYPIWYVYFFFFLCLSFWYCFSQIPILLLALTLFPVISIFIFSFFVSILLPISLQICSRVHLFSDDLCLSVSEYILSLFLSRCEPQSFNLFSDFVLFPLQVCLSNSLSLLFRLAFVYLFLFFYLSVFCLGNLSCISPSSEAEIPLSLSPGHVLIKQDEMRRCLFIKSNVPLPFILIYKF